MSTYDLLRPLLAAFIATIAVLAGAVLTAQWKPETGRRMAVWLAPAIGYMIGSWYVRGLPAFPPADAVGWVFWSMPVIGVAGLLLLPKRGKIIHWLGRIAMVAALLILLARPLLRGSWGGGGAFIQLALLGGAWLIVWAAILQGRRAQPSGFSLMLLTFCTIGLSILLMIGGVATYSQFILGLAGVLIAAGLGILVLFRQWSTDLFPAPALICVPWVGMLYAGYFYADVPLLSLVLALLAPLVFFLPSLARVRRLRSPHREVVQLAWILICFTPTIVWAYQNTPAFDF